MNKKIIILVILIGIVFFGFMQRGKTEMNIDNSYKNQPFIDLHKSSIEFTKRLTVELEDKLSFDCELRMDSVNDKIRINDISIRNVDRHLFEDASISVSSMRILPSQYRLNINIGSTNFFSSKVGSCLAKITRDSVVVFSKTDNIKVTTLEEEN